MINAILPILGSIIDKVIPDRKMAEKAKNEIAILEAKGDLDLMFKQLEINKEEAKHRSIFVAGWRPFIGWVCGIAFGYHFLLYPIVSLILTLNGVDNAILPEFDMTSLLTVLGGLLGLGSLRTVEKIKGITR